MPPVAVSKDNDYNTICFDLLVSMKSVSAHELCCLVLLLVILVLECGLSCGYGDYYGSACFRTSHFNVSVLCL